MRARSEVPLSELTTLRVGGPAHRLIETADGDEMVETVKTADAAHEPFLVMGSGSNLLVADEGFPGTVLRLTGGGIAFPSAHDDARLTVGAGVPWDRVVALSVEQRLAGIECLSGIPGLTGATPIQNVGAYGQEVAQTIVSVRVYDRHLGAIQELSPGDCGFAYRSSAFKGSSRWLVLSVTFELERSAEARPIQYPELARALGVSPGERPPLGDVREAVLALRRSKGMVLDPEDPDSVSAGSFFLNPLLCADEAAAFRARVVQRLGEDVAVATWPQDDGRTKVSAAWLIERAGFSRGQGGGRAGISTKHTLALVNRGGATAQEMVALARQLRDGVRDAFGVTLTPEPTLVGVEI